jgi:hypothetical protein
MRASFFQQTLGGSPSTLAMSVAKAAIDVAEKRIPLRTTCSVYNVSERDIVQFIIERAEYDGFNSALSFSA